MTMRLLLALAALVAATGVALAQSAPAPQPLIPVARQVLVEDAVDLAARQIIAVPLSKARLINLPQPVSDVVVANPDIADVIVKKPRQIFVIAQAIGTTTVFFMAQDGSVVLQAEIQVDIDARSIRAALAHLLPDSEINVKSYRDGVFLTGAVRSPEDSASAVAVTRRFVAEDTDIVNMLTVAGSQQVVLKVRVAEIARTVVKNLAVNQRVSIGGGGELLLNFTAPTALTGIDFFSVGNVGTGIDGVLSPSAFGALEEQGLIKTLAEPTLTAISGETANFLAGGEFPFPTGLDDNGNVVVEFRDFGIGLNFTPVVLNENRINLQISTEISAISQANAVTIAGFVIPGIATRRTETTVDMQSGGTIMIAGLLQDDATNNVRGFPFLKDVPVLGALFRSTQFSRNETELMVIVTVYLAKPIGNTDRLSAPTDGFVPASDVDIYLLGKLQKEYGAVDMPPWAVPLEGPYGYIME